MARILILGGGFAAVAAAETLARAVGDEHDITVISVNREFTFYPALVPLVFGDLRPDEISFDLPPRLAEIGVRFVQGEVLRIDPERREVSVAGGDVEGEVHFDYLLVAVGRRLATEKLPGFFDHAHHLLGIGPALRFREAVAGFDTGAIVVGLSPDSFLPVPVCEAALALAKKFERQIRDGDVSVTAVFPTTLEKAFAGAGLFRDLAGEFDRKGIRLVEEFPIEQVRERRILSSFGAALEYKLLMLVPPFGGQTPVRALERVTDATGFAQVNDLMQVKGFENIYAAGDIVSMPGPRFGYMAIGQGKTAAKNIIAQLKGETPTAEYTHRIAWLLAEKFTDPVFFHYGFWDETLDDHDEEAFFGMARRIRGRYGSIASDSGDMGQGVGR